ncbi:MAG: hypothetical protein WCE51_10160 [Chthoniobacterales bacterium]
MRHFNNQVLGVPSDLEQFLFGAECATSGIVGDDARALPTGDGGGDAVD